MMDSLRRESEAGAAFGSFDFGPRKAKKKKDKDKNKKKVRTKDKAVETLSRKERLAAVATNLRRMDGTIAQLRDRVADLHSVQLEHEEAGSVVLTRLGDLSERLRQEARQVAGVARQEAETRQRLDSLAAAVDGLRAEADVILEGLAQVVVQPDRDTALFAIEDRLQGTEDLLAALRGSLDDLVTGVSDAKARAVRLAELESFERRLNETGIGLRAHAERLGALERGLQEQARLGAEAARAEDRREVTLAHLGEGVECRLGQVEQDLREVRAAAAAQREDERTWIEGRLRAGGRRRTVGLSVLGALTLALIAAGWWHAEGRLGETAQGLAALQERVPAPANVGPARADERALDAALDRLDAALARADARETARGERLAGLAAPQAAVTEDLLARLRRLEATQADVDRSIADGVRGAAALDAEVAAAAAERADIERLLARTREILVGLDGRVAGFESRMDALSQRLDRQSLPPVSRSTATVGPTVLKEDRYAIQLIGFRRPTSVEPFARRFGIAREARYMRSRFRGRDWYVVLLGDYATRAEGLAAAEGLPAELLELDPWVRSLKAGARLIPVD